MMGNRKILPQPGRFRSGEIVHGREALVVMGNNNWGNSPQDGGYHSDGE